MSISYPYREKAKLSLPLFLLLSIIFPILTIIISISIFTPRHTRLQNLNASLLGLGVSLATSTVIFTGVKNLTGKPRPNFLFICDPDIDNIRKYKVGGFGTELGVMVSVDICRQSDEYALRDGFRSFPSGFATSTLFLSFFSPSFLGGDVSILYLC
jgi:membrane-associated phospholipid phosphatase